MRRKIPNIGQLKLLDRNWDSSTKQVFLFCVDFTEYDYAILLYCFENKLNSYKKSFKKTNLMWELNLSPNFYSIISRTVDKLVTKKLLCSAILKSHSRSKTRLLYYLTELGENFCEKMMEFNSKCHNFCDDDAAEKSI